MKTCTFKKTLSLFIAVIMVVATFSSFVTLNVSAAPSASNVDGNLNDAAWQTANWIYVDGATTGQFQNGTTGGFSYYYAIYATSTDIYVGVKLNQAGLFNEEGQATATNLRLWLDTDMSTSTRSHLFDFNYTGNAANPFKQLRSATEIMAGGDINGASCVEGKDFTYAGKSYGGSLTLEIKLVRANLVTTAAKKNEIGMALSASAPNAAGGSSYDALHSITYSADNAPWKTTAAYVKFDADLNTYGALTVDGNVSDWYGTWTTVDSETGKSYSATEGYNYNKGLSFKYQIRTDGDKLYVALVTNWAPKSNGADPTMIGTAAEDNTFSRFRLWFGPKANKSHLGVIDIIYDDVSDASKPTTKFGRGLTSTNYVIAGSTTANSWTIEYSVPLVDLGASFGNRSANPEFFLTVSDPRMCTKMEGLNVLYGYGYLDSGKTSDVHYKEKSWISAEAYTLNLKAYNNIPTEDFKADSLDTSVLVPNNVAEGKGYHSLGGFNATYPDAGCLTDGKAAINRVPTAVNATINKLDVGAGWMKNGWTSLTQDNSAGTKTYTVTVDLGRTYNAIGSFDVVFGTGEWGIGSIKNIEVKASIDGVKFAEVATSATTTSYDGSTSKAENWGWYRQSIVLDTTPGDKIDALTARFIQFTFTATDSFCFLNELAVYNYESITPDVIIDNINAISGGYAKDNTVLLTTFTAGKTVADAFGKLASAKEDMASWDAYVFEYVNGIYTCTNVYQQTDKVKYLMSDIVIPTNGFVFAVYKGTTNWDNYRKTIQVGDASYIYLGGGVEDLRDIAIELNTGWITKDGTDKGLNKTPAGAAVTPGDIKIYIGKPNYDKTSEKFTTNYYYQPTDADNTVITNVNGWKADEGVIFVKDALTNNSTFKEALANIGKAASDMTNWNIAVVEFNDAAREYKITTIEKAGLRAVSATESEKQAVKDARVNALVIPENGFILAGHGSSELFAEIAVSSVGDEVFYYGTAFSTLHNSVVANREITGTYVLVGSRFKTYKQADSLDDDKYDKSPVADLSFNTGVTFTDSTSITLGAGKLNDGDRALGTSSVLDDGVVLIENTNYKTKDKTLTFVIDNTSGKAVWNATTGKLNTLFADFFVDYGNSVGFIKNNKITVQFSKNGAYLSEVYEFTIDAPKDEKGVDSVIIDLTEKLGKVDAAYVVVKFAMQSGARFLAMTEFNAIELVSDVVTTPIVVESKKDTSDKFVPSKLETTLKFNNAFVDLEATPYIAIDIDLPTKAYGITLSYLSYTDDSGIERNLYLESAVLATMNRYGTIADGVYYWNLAKYLEEYGINVNDLVKINQLYLNVTVDNGSKVALNYFGFVDFDATTNVTIKDTSKLKADEAKKLLILDNMYTVEELKKQFNGEIVIKNDANGKIGTGTIIVMNGVEFKAVLYGDGTGDGIINTSDYILARRAILGLAEIDDTQKEALSARVGALNSTSYIRIRMHVLGTYDVVKGEKIAD